MPLAGPISGGSGGPSRKSQDSIRSPPILLASCESRERYPVRAVRRISLVLLLASSLSAGRAEAKEPKTDVTQGSNQQKSAPRRIVVDHFQGEGGQKRVRSEVTRVLDQEQSVDLVSVELLDAHRTHDVSVDGSAEGYAEVAAKLNVVALIRGRVTKSEGHQVLALMVLNGQDGRRLGRVELKADTLKELREKVAAELWRQIEPVLAQAGQKPAESDEAGAAKRAGESEVEAAEAELKIDKNPYLEAEEAEPRETAEPTRPPPEPPSRATRDCSWLEIAPRSGTLARSFSYENERSGALREYTLDRSPIAALEVAAYPGALQSCGLASGIGLRLGYEQLLGASSQIAGRELETSGSAARAELVFRIPIGPVGVEPAIGYYRRRFVVEKSYVPDPVYQALGGGLKLDVRLGVFIAEARSSVRFVLDSGQLESDRWFPGASGLGYDASALVGVAPLPWLDVFVGAYVERYAFDLNQTEPTDGREPPARVNGVADQAHDHFTSFALGLRFRLSKHARSP
jgi:hypothetical protein